MRDVFKGNDSISKAGSFATRMTREHESSHAIYMVAPATIRAFRSNSHFSLPSDHRGTVVRNSLLAPIEKLPQINEGLQ
ncbi:hypothetical protein DSM110093_04243 (plasmid) [Sulfitobacter sp. DSM 110093]|nr:hypothetical protein DSM110093_04243 [Sulfitobacter sp. DSM 110093]